MLVPRKFDGMARGKAQNSFADALYRVNVCGIIVKSSFTVIVMGFAISNC